MFKRKRENRLKIQDELNHLLGQYIYIALNNPKEYPKKPFLSEEVKNTKKIQSSEEMERMARINTICLGGVIKK